MEQEYIKGDIVMYDNKIHTIMDTLGVNNYELSYISHPVHQLELSGVPITPEILEKNGWKRVDDEPIDFEIKYFGTKFSNGVNLFYNVLTDIYRYDKHTILIYLHELQHLLFGLRLNSEMEV